MALSGRIERAMAMDYVAGMQVAVVFDGELRYRGAWGTQRYEGDEPVTNDTLFRWASLSKMHTATAVLQLVDEGEVDLEAARNLPCHTGVRLLGGSSHALGRVNAEKRVQLVRGDREINEVKLTNHLDVQHLALAS